MAPWINPGALSPSWRKLAIRVCVPPLPIRRAGLEPASVPRKAAQAGHLGIEAGLVDEYQPAWLAAEANARRQAASGGTEGRNAPEHLIVYRKPGRDALKRPFPARPIKDARGAWHAALDRVGADRRYRFHDVRATYITQIAHVAPDKVTQDLARHADTATMARYVKFADDAKNRAVAMMPRAGGAAQPGNFAMRSPDQDRGDGRNED